MDDLGREQTLASDPGVRGPSHSVHDVPLDFPGVPVTGRSRNTLLQMLSAVAFTARTGWARVADLSRISDLLEDPGVLLWATADAAHLSQEDVSRITAEFGLHPLAVEDAIRARQRPKVETYPGHGFVVAHELEIEDGRVEPRQVACFFGERYVLVIHAGAERVLDEARARLQRPRRIEASLIVHSILDAIVDEYDGFASAIETEVEELEDHMLERPHAHQAGLFSLRRRMTHLRRYSLPTERLLEQIVKGPQSSTAPESFRDVHDHTLRVNDTLDSVADILAAIFDLQRSEQGAHLSEVTKRLSGWAAIIAVPTLIASIYGMNFELVPQENSINGYGFIMAVTAMAVTGVSLWWLMRKRGWL